MLINRPFLSVFIAISLAFSACSQSDAPSDASSSFVPRILPNQIKNFVTFGDSFTDIFWVANGGTQWPTYVVDYTKIKLFPYARSGATCSNDITYRPFPSLFESQLPSYLQDKNNGTVKLRPQETVYTLWIGTNDLGSNALLTRANGTLVDVAKCMVNWVKVLYQSGARNFIFQNMVPLETIPLYAAESYPNRYWTASRNSTEWSLFMKEMILSGNLLTKLLLTDLLPSLPGAHLALFDSHSLFTDIYNQPQLYLNGTVPYNTTGSVDSCVYPENADTTKATPECTVVTGSARDSYLWYDELHPSEQSSRIVAREISQVLQGKRNKWTTWLS